MKAYIFGAGSSFGTLGKICPPAATFGKQLANWPGQFPDLDRVAAHLDRKYLNLSLEDLWTCIDYYYKLAQPGGALPWADWIPAAELDLKRALLRVYGRTCDEKAGDLISRRDYTLRNLLTRVDPGDVLISFNYDTLVERLAGGLGGTLCHFHSELRTDVVNFAKPHGSASWCLDHDLKSLTNCHPDGAPLLDSMLEIDVSPRRTPLLLGAVPIKSELIREVQLQYQVPDVFGVVMAQWKAIIEAVRQADELIVVGYSFPKEDQYGRFLFHEAIRGRDPQKRLRVEYYETSDNDAKVAEAILGTLPFRGIQIEPKGPVSGPA